MIAAAAAAVTMPLLGPVCAAGSPTPRDLRFSVLRQEATIGAHSVAFRMDGDRLIVETHIDITVRLWFFTVFRLKHDAHEVWQSGRLVSIASTTQRDDVRLEVSGEAVDGGFRIVGTDGPFLSAGHLLTSNSLWDSRILRESRLIDAQYGGEIGLVARSRGEELVQTPQGPVYASRYQIITPHIAGSLFFDGDQRWVRALIEAKGEAIEYVLTT